MYSSILWRYQFLSKTFIATQLRIAAQWKHAKVYYQQVGYRNGGAFMLWKANQWWRPTTHASGTWADSVCRSTVPYPLRRIYRIGRDRLLCKFSEVLRLELLSTKPSPSWYSDIMRKWRPLQRALGRQLTCYITEQHGVCKGFWGEARPGVGAVGAPC